MLTAHVDATHAQQKLGHFARQVPFAAALTLTRTAQDVRADLRTQMQQSFDRPTPFTLNSLQVEPATKANLRSAVRFRDFAGKGTPAGKYLRPQVEGGARRLKRFERAMQHQGILPVGKYAVPGRGARLNQYGNMSPGQIVQILSALGANPDAFQNRTARSARRKRQRDIYVWLDDDGQPKGVIERTGRDRIKVLLVFVKHAVYQQRFRMFETASQTIQRRLQANFESAIARAIATAR